MSLPPAYFEALYRDSEDPWSFRTRWYEARKRSLVLAALLSPRYRSAFEPGCSNGTLTAALADRCDRLVAMDVSPAALAAVPRDLGARVDLRQGSVPVDWPEGRFDLVVLSEVGYYLDHPDCTELMQRATASSAEILCIHWRHRVGDYPLTGDEVHLLLGEVARRRGWTQMMEHQEPDFVLEIWAADRRSVAQREGVPGA